MPSWTCLIPARVFTRPLIASTEEASWEWSCLRDLSDDRISCKRALVSGAGWLLVAIVLCIEWSQDDMVRKVGNGEATCI